MSKQTTVRRVRPRVGGEWVDGGADPLAVTDLAEGGTFARVAAADAADAERALDGAADAEAAMRETTVVQRAGWCEAIATGIEERADELADVVAREAGKPVGSARGEVAAAAERFRRAAAEVRDRTGEFRRGSTASHEGWQAVVAPEPVGTVLCIAPFNYPLSTPALTLAPALAAGNSVVLKPASKTPVSAALLTEIVVEAADLPDGAVAFVPGRGSEVGDTLAGDERVRAISMTGSAAAGKRVADAAGLTHLHMELGGNAPAVVFPDADLGATADAVAGGALSYAGQRCSAVSRVLVHGDVHDELVDLLADGVADRTLGGPFDDGADVGPLVDTDAVEWVDGLVTDAVDRGADLVAGGERAPPADAPADVADRYYAPTLLADVPADARIVAEEQFGPVLPVVPVADEADALAVADRGDLALDAAVFTADHDRAMRVADRLDAGAVRVNGAPSHGIGDVPFGGNGASGIGRQGIGETIEALTREKSIVL
jgi:glyceraldehyde-3-phosphate dehydrogenase [NAD(P)+]